MSKSTEEKKLGYTGEDLVGAWFLGGPGRGHANGYGGKVSPCRSKGLQSRAMGHPLLKGASLFAQFPQCFGICVELLGKFKSLAESGLRNGGIRPTRWLQG